MVIPSAVSLPVPKDQDFGTAVNINILIIFGGFYETKME
jgi:hypothetical protein